MKYLRGVNYIFCDQKRKKSQSIGKGKLMNIEQLLAEAWKSIQNEQLQDAIIYLETVLEMERYNLEALLMLIRIYLKTENFDLALRYSERAYEKYDENLDIIFYMGFLYQAIGKNKKAVSYYKKFLDVEKDYHVLLNLGICYTKLNFNQKAAETFDEAISLEPENTEGYLEKAEFLGKMGKYDEAIEIYEDRLKAENNNVEEFFIYMQMGDMMARAGKEDKAIEYYNISINCKNVQDYVFEKYYDFLMDRKKYDDIELLLLNYENSNHEKKNVLNLEGRFASEMNDFKRAEKVCKKLVALYPENPINYINFAYVMEMQNRFDEALNYVEEASKYTDNPEKIKKIRKRIMSSKRKFEKLKRK